MTDDPTPRLCGDRGCTEPAYRCDRCGAEGCMYALRKACRCEGGPDESPLYDEAPAAPRDHGDPALNDLQRLIDEERDRRLAEVRARIQERLAQPRPAASPFVPPPDHAEAAAEIAALLDADDASPEGMVCVEASSAPALDLDAIESRAMRRRRFCERCNDPAAAECVAGGECDATRCGAHQPAEEWGHIHRWVPLDDGVEDVLAVAAQLRILASAVHTEHVARLAWLATLPDAPKPQALLDAEAATREALRRVA